MELHILGVRREQLKNSLNDFNTAKREVSVVLRHFRNASKIPLKQVADDVQCSVAYLSDIELGRRFPTEEVLSDIVKSLTKHAAQPLSKRPKNVKGDQKKKGDI